LATTRSSKLLEQHGTATAEILSAEIGEGATEGMTPSSGRLRWSAWTARYGDPTAAFLRLAAEFGVVTVDGPAVSLTPLGAWAVIHQVGAKVEVLSASAALTPIQLIICWLGMSGETFEQELHAWLAAREQAGAVTALLEAAAEEDAAYLTTGVQIAAGIEGDTGSGGAGAPGLRHLIVDECQDVNPAQERLIRRLTGPRVELCVVGDDDQAIYQWRGSDARNIVEFASRRLSSSTNSCGQGHMGTLSKMAGLPVGRRAYRACRAE
jgi:hypothetical protein